MDYLNNKFYCLYTPESGVSLDESLMTFKGWQSYVLPIDSKRARFDIQSNWESNL